MRACLTLLSPEFSPFLISLLGFTASPPSWMTAACPLQSIPIVADPTTSPPIPNPTSSPPPSRRPRRVVAPSNPPPPRSLPPQFTVSLVARSQAAATSYSNDKDNDNGAEDPFVENGGDETTKKVKLKKVNKPKITVAKAASKIDETDLFVFLADISVRDLNFGFYGSLFSRHHLSRNRKFS